MAKQISTGIGGVTKKVKKIPIGVGGVTKEAKKGVCGVGGVVKTCYESNIVLFENGVTDYSWTNATTSGNYFIIGKEYRYPSAANDGYCAYLSEKLDLSPYSKLRVEIIDSSQAISMSNKYGYLSLYDKGYDSYSFGTAHISWVRTPGGTFNLTMDLTNLEGNYDIRNFQICLGFSYYNAEWYYGGQFSDMPKITKMWFEE